MLSSVILSAVIKLIWDIYFAPVAPIDDVSLVGVPAFPGSLVSATPKLYSSKLQTVFVQIVKCICPDWKIYLSKLQNVFVYNTKCICPNCQICLTPIDVISLVGVAAIVYPPLPNFKGDGDQDYYHPDLDKFDDDIEGEDNIGVNKKANDLQRGFYNKMVFGSPGPIYLVWVSKAYLYSLSSRSLYLCVLDICICVRETSVFAAWGGWDSPDTDTAASNTIWLPHLYQSLVYLSGG